MAEAEDAAKTMFAQSDDEMWQQHVKWELGIAYLNALRVEMVRHRAMGPEARQHELFQTSTIEALLGGAFEGDVSLSEILQHGDLGLGTLNGLDGELIVIDGQAWKANRDCKLIRAPGSSRTPRRSTRRRVSPNCWCWAKPLPARTRSAWDWGRT